MPADRRDSSRHGRRRAAVLAGLLLGWQAGVLAGPAGADGDRFIHVVDSGDTLIGLADRYLGDARKWTELQRINQVADPRRLPPGLRIRIPFSWIPTRPAKVRVIAASGTVRLGDTPLRPGTQLDEAARVVTGADGRATLELDDGSRVALPPDSVVEVSRLRVFARALLQDAVLRIERGGADASVAPNHNGVGRFEMRTRTMITGVRGTRFEVEASGAESRSTVLEGRVTVAARRGSQEVPDGFGIAVGPGGRLAPPRPLQAAPILQPLPARIYAPSLNVAWQPAPGATAWRVSVSRDSARTEPIWSATMREPHATPAGLPHGRLYLSVRAIGADGFAGYPAVAPLDVKLEPAAPFTLEPGARTRHHGSAITLQWAAVANASRYEIELARDAGCAPVEARETTAEVSWQVPLAPGDWWWRIRSLDADGEPGPWSAVLPFSISPAAPAAAVTGDDGAVLRLGWGVDTTVAKPAAYRLQLADDPRFAHVLADLRSTEGEAAVPRPPAGDYWVRVARIEPDGATSPYSAPQRIALPAYLRDAAGNPVRATDAPVRHGG